MAGAPQGNTNAADGKRWKLAIEAALEKRGQEKWAALTDLAATLLNKAAEGDMGALRELGDRIDGKPAQQMVMTGKDDGPIQIERTVKLVGGD